LEGVHTTTRLELASGGNGGGSTTATDGTGGGTASLDGLDDGHGGDVTVGDLTEDDVTAVEPAGDDSGDEELRAVGVGASVGHGEHERLLVGELEVLVGELLTIDGLATSAVATGEVTTLEHEVRDDTVELGARVAEALLASAESAEVLDGLGDNVIEELEVDAAGALLNLAVGVGGLAAGINVDLRTGPGAVEVNLLNHVCG